MSANVLNVESDEQTVERLLEIAVNNDVQGLLDCVQHKPACVDSVGVWYGRRRGSRNWSIPSQRTPLMVAAACGSFGVVKQIISWSKADVNHSCGPESVTVLHCAASSGSVNAVAIVHLLLDAGADPNLADAHGLRPRDVIVEAPRFPWLKDSLERMLTPGKKQGPISIIPAINSSSRYYTDEFMMYSFKVRECFLEKRHEWERCPMFHPRRGDRRRDLSEYHYRSYPCKFFRSFCIRGDKCRFAHGAFESGLHPDRYRTHLCTVGAKCTRKVCFSAHTQEQLRPPTFTAGTNILPNSSPLSTSSLSRDIHAMNLSYANIEVHQQQQQKFLNEQSISTKSLSAVYNQYQTESSQTVDHSLLLRGMSGQTPMIARREEQHQRLQSLQFGSNAPDDHAASLEETAYSNSSEGERSNS